MYLATLQTIAAGGQKRGFDNLAFALNYSREVVNLVKNRGFNNFVLSMMGDKIPKGRRGALAATVRITLLVIALALLTEVELGSYNPGHIKQLLDEKWSGKNLSQNDPRWQLIYEINIQKELIKDEKERARVMKGLMSHLNKSRGMKSKLTDVGTAFDSIFEEIVPNELSA